VPTCGRRQAHAGASDPAPGADQFVNGATAEAVGVALTIPPVELTSDGVTDAVHRLLENPSFGAAARRAQDEIAGLPTHDDVLAALLADAAAA
jgi:UDP:flavonoid glycosyltransferase YjiC (YdhE family)